MTSSRFLVAPALALLVLGCPGGGGSGGGTATFSISGTVSGAVAANVLVSLSGKETSSTTTNSAGAFSFTGLPSGSYTLRPTLSGYTFTPPSASVTVNGASQSGVDFTSSVGPPANVVPITVNGSLCSSSAYMNEPCVAVTICSPTTGACQTIDGILLDTGSVGLRVFAQLLTVPLTPIASGTGQLAECLQFGSFTDWGPVETASVVLGGEPAASMPIQVIESTYASPPSACASAITDPTTAGFNGILGVNFFAQDCGVDCASTVGNGVYYACTTSGTAACSEVAAPLANQVPNPVGLLATDNNGVIVQLPVVPPQGLLSASGTLLLGIGTRSNNVPSGVTKYSVDQFGGFETQLGGVQYPGSFLDTGSNGFFFAAPDPSQLPACTCPTGIPPSECADYTGWFCPASTLSLTATNIAATGSPSGPVSFSIANFLALSSSLNVFPDVGGPDPSASDGFDWGLPFYFGLDVYFGLEGTTSSLGTGPYVAY